MKHNPSEFVPFVVIIDLATDKAIRALVLDPDNPDDEDEKWRWIPRSIIENGDEIKVGDDELSIARWWAEKEGLA